MSVLPPAAGLTTRSSERRLAVGFSCTPRLASPASVAELESVRRPARTMSKSRFLPDVLSSVVALVVGLSFALYLHGKWYYGGWMALFGDPPMSDPAYGRFLPLFEAVPYVAAGISAGLLSGFGHPHPSRVLVRCTALVVLFLLLASRSHHLASSAFIPFATGFFALSLILSLAYFRLLAFTTRPTPVA